MGAGRHLVTSGVADFVPNREQLGLGRGRVEERDGGRSRVKGPGSPAEVLWVLRGAPVPAAVKQQVDNVGSGKARFRGVKKGEKTLR